MAYQPASADVAAAPVISTSDSSRAGIFSGAIYFDQVARVVADVADALQHAHDEGDFTDRLLKGWAAIQWVPEQPVRDLKAACELKPASNLVRLLYAQALRVDAENLTDPQQGLAQSERAIEALQVVRALLPDNSRVIGEWVLVNLVAADRHREFSGFVAQRSIQSSVDWRSTAIASERTTASASSVAASMMSRRFPSSLSGAASGAIGTWPLAKCQSLARPPTPAINDMIAAVRRQHAPVSQVLRPRLEEMESASILQSCGSWID